MKTKIIQWIAWHLPRKIIYWCAVRVFCDATSGKYSDQMVPELTAMDALKRFDYKGQFHGT